MNRIIKFRIWDKGCKVFVKNFDIEIDIAQYDFGQMKNCVVQQFTGLKDKNGKEIYEGDLLKISEKDRPNYFKDYCHVWYSDSGCFVVSFNHLYSETSCELFMVNYTYEIIGNIFENPELL